MDTVPPEVSNAILTHADTFLVAHNTIESLVANAEAELDRELDNLKGNQSDPRELKRMIVTANTGVQVRLQTALDEYMHSLEIGNGIAHNAV